MTDYLQPPLEPSPVGLKRIFDEYLEANLEGWQPNEANLDDRIGGALSVITPQLMEAASDGATSFFRFLGAAIFGVPPKEGTFATGTTTWVATDAVGHVIPAGTLVLWLDGSGARRGFETTAEATIEAGKSSVAGVPVRAQLVGPESNNLGGAALELQTSLPFVASVTLSSPTNGGSEAELDSAYLTRLKEELRTLSRKLIRPSDFNSYLLARQPVGRVTTIAGFNPTATIKPKGALHSTKEVTGLTLSTETVLVGTAVTGAGIPANTRVIRIISGSAVELNNAATETKESELTFTGLTKQPGHLTSWVGTSAGTALTAEQEAVLLAEVEGEVLAGVVPHIQPPTFTALTAEATVFAWPGQNAATIKAAVEAAIKSYLSGERWGQPPTGQTKEWNNDPKVRLVNVEHAILQVIGTHYVAELKINGGTSDVTMTGVVALPELTTLTVNVNIG
jgi:hypothetical protein